MSSASGKAGIYIPIVPGILPIHSFAQVANFSARCGAHVPAWLAERFAGLEKDPQTHALVASAVAVEQVLDLVERGVNDFHFYTMNRADLVVAVCHMIGIRSQAPATGAGFGCGVMPRKAGTFVPAFPKLSTLEVLSSSAVQRPMEERRQ